VNDSSPTLLTRPGQNKAIIDLTFVSPSLLSITDSHTHSDTFFSDHFPISISINYLFPKKSFFTYKIKLTKEKIKALQESLHSDLPQIQSELSSTELSPEQKYNHLVNFIETKLPYKNNNSFLKHNANKTHSNSPNPALWRSDICEEALLNRKKAMSLYKKDPSLINYMNFKKQEALAKKSFKKEKRKSWKKFCHSPSYNTPISHIWKFIKRYKNRYLNTLLPYINSNNGFPDEVIMAINDISPSSVSHQIFQSMKDFPISHKCPIFDTPFTIAEFSCIIKKL